MLQVTVKGKNAFVYLPFPDYWIDIGHCAYHFSSLDHLRDSQIDEDLKKGLLLVLTKEV